MLNDWIIRYLINWNTPNTCLGPVCCCLLAGLTHCPTHLLVTVLIFPVTNMAFSRLLGKQEPNWTKGASLHLFLLFKRIRSLFFKAWQIFSHFRLWGSAILQEATEESTSGLFWSWSEEALNRQNMLEMCTSLLPMSLANWLTREALILTLKNIRLRGVGRGMESAKWKKEVWVGVWGRCSREKQLGKKSKGKKCGENEEEIKNIHTSQKPKRWWYAAWMKTQQECWGKEALNSLRAYTARIRPSNSLGVTGLTNPSHTSSPRDPGLPALPLRTLNLLNLTRLPLISRHLTLSPRWISGQAMKICQLSGWPGPYHKEKNIWRNVSGLGLLLGNHFAHDDEEQ